MTLVAIVLVATCLVAGMWAVGAEHVDRRQERRKIPQGRTRGAAPSRGSRFAAWHGQAWSQGALVRQRGTERSHVRLVDAPYDWEEHDG